MAADPRGCLSELEATFFVTEFIIWADEYDDVDVEFEGRIGVRWTGCWFCWELWPGVLLGNVTKPFINEELVEFYFKLDK